MRMVSRIGALRWFARGIAIAAACVTIVSGAQAQTTPAGGTGEPGLVTDALAESALGSRIVKYRFGDGPRRVLLWGDLVGVDSLSSRVLTAVTVDLAGAANDLAATVRSALTIHVIPAVNIDAAGMHRHGRNAQGVSLVLDSSGLAPETRGLLAFIDSVRPEIVVAVDGWRGVAEGDHPMAIGVVAAPAGPEDPAFRLASGLAVAAASESDAQIALLPLDSTGRSIVHRLQANGVPTILIDAGAGAARADSATVRTAVEASLGALAGGLQPFVLDLPVATEVATAFSPVSRADLLVTGGRIELPGRAPLVGDIALGLADDEGRFGATVLDIGDLRGIEASDSLDATGSVVSVKPGGDDPDAVVVGRSSTLDVRRGSAFWSRREWVVYDAGLEPWREHARHRNGFYAMVAPDLSAWMQGGIAPAVIDILETEGWGDDFDHRYPASSMDRGFVVTFGYRTRGQYRYELTLAPPISGVVAGMNLNELEQLRLDYSTRAVGLIAGRSFGRLDIGGGPIARSFTYDWSGAARHEDRTNVMGFAIDAAVTLVRLGPTMHVQALGRWERYGPVGLRRSLVEEPLKVEFSGLRLGVSVLGFR